MEHLVAKLLKADSWPGVKGSPWLLIDEMVHRSLAPEAKARRAALVEALLACLKNSSSLNERVFLLRQLALAGGQESVPLLVQLLDNADRVVQEYTLRALEANSSEAAGSAILSALDREGPAAWHVALINALGSRRESNAMPRLRELLRSEEDPDVADAMRAALTHIGGDR